MKDARGVTISMSSIKLSLASPSATDAHEAHLASKIHREWLGPCFMHQLKWGWHMLPRFPINRMFYLVENHAMPAFACKYLNPPPPPPPFCGYLVLN